MPPVPPLVAVDHPAWRPSPDGGQHRVVTVDDEHWLVAVRRGRDLVYLPIGAPRRPPLPGAARLPEGHPPAVPALARALEAVSSLIRVRSDLWQALAVALIRKQTPDAEVDSAYDRLCVRHGQRIALPEPVPGDYHLFPPPAVMAELTDEQFAAVGLADVCLPLRAAAVAAAEHSRRWQQLPNAELFAALRQVPHVGRWAAGAAVADHTGSYTFYQTDCPVLRARAQLAAPGHRWPAGLAAFGDYWHVIGGAWTAPMTSMTLALHPNCHVALATRPPRPREPVFCVRR